MVVLLLANYFKVDQLPDFDVLATSMTNAAEMQNLPAADVRAQLIRMQEQVKENTRQMKAGFDLMQEQFRELRERVDTFEQTTREESSRSYVDLCHFFRGLN